MIYPCEHHDRVLALWRERERTGIRLAHVDFHDDLRGLLIDRRRGCARAIGRFAREAAAVDAGNFLAHAVAEGRVASIRWVHDRVGGRAWDAGIVRYESDRFAWRHKRSAGAEFPLSFEEVLLEEWQGPEPGEQLSVDWDCFASILQDAGGIGRRTALFLDRLAGAVPPECYLAYSGEYCHPSLPAFLELVRELEARFAQPVEWLSPGLPEGRLQPTGVDPFPPRDPLTRFVLFLRRRGIF